MGISILLTTVEVPLTKLWYKRYNTPENPTKILARNNGALARAKYVPSRPWIHKMQETDLLIRGD